MYLYMNIYIINLLFVFNQQNHHGMTTSTDVSSTQSPPPSTSKPTNFECVAKSVDLGSDLPQGVKFSPDGLCVLTSAGNRLRLYNTPSITTSSACTSANTSTTEQVEWKTILESHGGDTVRAYDWYPHMESSNPSTCCFVGTSRDQPVHLYDAYTGSVRATYRPYNRLDELESPTVVSFSPDGQKLYCGGFRTDRCLHVFETNVPGRESTISLLGKTRRSSDGQKGIVSSICHGSSVMAVGTYAPGSIYLYDNRSMSTVGTILNGVCVVGHGRSHSKKKRRFAAMDDGEDLFSSAKIKWFQTRAQGGVTQLQFGTDNYTLFSLSRRSDAVLAWDVRMMTGQDSSRPICGIKSYATDHDTNQRLEFDFDENGRLVVGGRDNCVRIYDVPTGLLVDTLDGLHSAANGVSCHGSLVTVAVGSRVFPTVEDYDKEGDEEIVAAKGSLEMYKVTSVPFSGKDNGG